MGRTPVLIALLCLLGLPGSAGAVTKLPPATLHGPIDLLVPYPVVELASPAEHNAAEALLARVRVSAARYEDPAAALADGYLTRRRQRDPGDRTVGWLHAERDPGRPFFDPARPKAIVYASVPGEPLVLAGVMFSLPRGLRGETPGGPVTRWHSHYVCREGARRGTAARAGGRCPAGNTKRQGSEMMHVWLTDDLASAFALHAPEPELCSAGRVPRVGCGRWPRLPVARWPGHGWQPFRPTVRREPTTPAMPGLSALPAAGRDALRLVCSLHT